MMKGRLKTNCESRMLRSSTALSGISKCPKYCLLNDNYFLIMMVCLFALYWYVLCSWSNRIIFRQLLSLDRL